MQEREQGLLNGEQPYLWTFEATARARALTRLMHRDITGFLALAVPAERLATVMMNRVVLCHLGLFEYALYEAYITSAHPLVVHPSADLGYLFSLADRARLRVCGDTPAVSQAPYTLYRGVAGHRRVRHTRGFSWTGTRAIAEAFAQRAASGGLARPAVLTCHVPESTLLFYTNAKNEDEYVLLLSSDIRITGGKVGEPQ